MTSVHLTSSVLSLGAGLSLLGVLIYGRLQKGRQSADSLESFDLQFARDLRPESVVSFISSLTGLLLPWWRRIFGMPAVVISISADANGITHRLLVPKSITGFVLAQLRAALPAVRVTPTPLDSPQLARACELRLTTNRRPLRVQQPASVTSALLATLQPLGSGERAVMEWTITPVAPVQPVRRTAKNNQNGLIPLLEGRTVVLQDSDDLRAAKDKQATAQFSAVARFGVQADTKPRANQLLARMTAALHITNSPGVHLRRRQLPNSLILRRMARHSVPLIGYPSVFNASELAALVAFPIGTPALSGLRLGGARQLEPSALIPRTGRVIAQSTSGETSRPIAISAIDSLAHVHVLGPTGSGKSTLLLNLITQDMEAGHGVVVVDPKGDLIEDCLDRVPLHRLRDVIVLDPADEDRPVGLNPLGRPGADQELVVDQVVSIFHQIFAESWGPRTDDILRAALLTLVNQPGMTLCEVPVLLTQDDFRARLVGRLDDSVLEGFWASYDAMSPAERALSPRR